MITPRNVKSSGARRSFGLWEPSDLTNLHTWFDASDSTDTSKIGVSGSNVTDWYNLASTGSTYDLYALAGNTTNPVVSTSHKIGGLDTIEFDGTGGAPNNATLRSAAGAWMFSPVNTPTNEFYVFWISKCINTRTANIFLASGAISGSNEKNPSYLTCSSPYFHANSSLDGRLIWDYTGNAGSTTVQSYNNVSGRRSNTNNPNLAKSGDVYIASLESSMSNNARNIYLNGVDSTTNGIPLTLFYGNTGIIMPDDTWSDGTYGIRTPFYDYGDTYNGQTSYIAYQAFGENDHAYLWWDGANWYISDVGVDVGGLTKEAIGGTTAADPTAGTWTNVNGFTAVGTLKNDHDSTARWGQIGWRVTEALGEVIVVAGGALSVNDRQKVEGYLAHKWNQTGLLDVSHPYKSTPPKK